MPIRHALPAAMLLSLTLLFGQITDKTTGQPLRGVVVDAQGAHASANATTDARGRFHLRLAPGWYTLEFQSNDVPPQEHRVRVRGSTQHVGLQACSTTLDYSCANPFSSAGG